VEKAARIIADGYPGERDHGGPVELGCGQEQSPCGNSGGRSIAGACLPLASLMLIPFLPPPLSSAGELLAVDVGRPLLDPWCRDLVMLERLGLVRPVRLGPVG